MITDAVEHQVESLGEPREVLLCSR
jgi:hypothetical protein